MGVFYGPENIALVELDRPITGFNDSLAKTIGMEADFVEKCDTPAKTYEFGWRFSDTLEETQTQVQNDCRPWRDFRFSFENDWRDNVRIDKGDFIFTMGDKEVCYVSNFSIQI